MNALLVATRNQGKLKEISRFLSDLPIRMLSLTDIGIDEDFEEKGKNYKENSRNKAIFYANKSGLPTVSDDGGIEIAALGGAPGVKSRRWIGRNSTDERIIKHMEKIAKQLPENKRLACFKTIVSFALPTGKVWSSYGEVKGIIARRPYLKLLRGYPYRSFFYLPTIKKYYHESDLTEEEEKLFNHRYKAIQKLKPIIAKELKLLPYLENGES